MLSIRDGLDAKPAAKTYFFQGMDPSDVPLDVFSSLEAGTTTRNRTNMHYT